MVSGIACTWSSPVLAILTDEEKVSENPFGSVITSEEESWIGSLLALGAVLGPLPCGLLADRIGRKPTLLLLATPVLVSFIILAFAKTIPLYYIARFMVGFSVGGAYTVLPIFISEIAEVSNRGILSSTFNGVLTLGMLISYSLGPYVSIMVFNIICAIFPLIYVVLLFFFVPESPVYYMKKNRREDAQMALKTLRAANTEKELMEELREMELEIETSAEGSIKDLFRNKGLVKALIISVSLASFQPLSGIDVVQFYTQTIFEATGSSMPAEISSILMGSVQFLAGFITPLFVERLGRKVLLLASAIGMVISEVPLGIYFYLNTETDFDVEKIFWLPTVSLMVYIVAFNYGFGPLPWTVMGEVFPSSVKSIASGLTASICWTLSFIMTRFFLTISDAITIGVTFWLFASFCFIAGIFVITIVPETKGKTFAEIQKQFNT